MTFRAPAAGVSVGRGHIRVDARRALAKLREYQLADPTDWVLEAIRAGMASGATEIALDGDSNDVWLAWTGRAWPLEDIPELLSELVGPVAADPSRRLLARAINSALGAHADFVDVFVFEEGNGRSFRFNPESFAESGAHPSSEACTASPILQPETGMLVHVRRRLGIDVIRNLVRGEPPEIAHARHACRAHDVPLRIRAKSLPPSASRHLLRVNLGRGLDGYVALTKNDEWSHSPGIPLFLSEQGVELEARHATLFPDSDAIAGTDVPIAIFVNAERLPSNASRSRVREDTHPLSTTLAALPAALTALVEAWCAQLEASPDEVDLREAAFALLARFCASPNWPSRLHFLPEAYRPIARLPLLRNALGDRRPLVSSWQAYSPHLGSAPYPREFAPWLSDVPWLPKGDPARRLHGTTEPASNHFKTLARRARRGLRRQRSFLKKKSAPPRFDDTSDFVLWADMGTVARSSTLRGYRDQLARVTGQIGILHKGKEGITHVRHAGRELERIQGSCLLPHEAIVEHGELVPRPDYRSAERNDAFEFLTSAVALQLVAHVECLLLAQHGELSEGVFVDSKRVMQCDATMATGWALGLLARAGIAPTEESPLALQPHFVDVDGRRHSLADLRNHAVVAVTSATSPTARPSHLLLRGYLKDVADLGTLVGSDTELVFYPPEALRSPASNTDSLLAQIGTQSRPSAILQPRTQLEIDGRMHLGAIAWSRQKLSRMHVQHLSTNLVDRPIDSLRPPCEVLVRADHLKPLFLSPEETDLGGLAFADFAAWRDELFWASCRYLTGEDDVDGLSVLGYRDELARSVLLASEYIDLRRDDGTLDPIFARAEIFPTVLGDRSAQELDARGTDVHYYLFPDSIDIHEARNLGWDALILSKGMASAAAGILGQPLMPGGGELLRRTNAREYEQRYRNHRKGARVTPQGIFERSAGKSAIPSAAFDCHGAAVIAWPGKDPGTLSMTFLLEDRILTERTEASPLPVEAVIVVTLDMLDSRFGLREEHLQNLRNAVEDHVETLAMRACGEDYPFGSSQPVQSFLRAVLDNVPTSPVFRNVLRQGLRFRTVQGTIATLEECTRDESLQTGRFSGTWLQGKTPHDVADAPILRIAKGESHELLQLLEVLVPSIADVSDTIQAVQAKRRVEQGFAQRPSLASQNVSAVRGFEALAIRDLGIGEFGLCDDDASPALLLYSEGELGRELEGWTRLPVALAIENPALRRSVVSSHGLSADWRERLELAAIEYLRQIESELNERLLSTSGSRLESCLRYLLMAGHELPPSIGELPLFPCLEGPSRSWADLRGLADDTIWYVGVRVDMRPLDDSRLVLLLDEDDIPALPLLWLHEATEELRMDELARENWAEAPLRDLELPAAVVRESMARRHGDDLAPPLGDVAVLRRPLLRGIDVVHDSRLVCSLPDPCPWPTAAVAMASAAGLRINRAHDGIEPGPELDALYTEVRMKSRQLLLDHYEPPEDRLASTWFFASISPEGGIVELSPSAHRPSDTGRIVAGRLWLSGASRALGILVTEEHKSRRRIPKPRLKNAIVALPIEGVLELANPDHSLSESEVESIAKKGYARLVRNMSSSWNRSSRDARHEEHVKLALRLGLVGPKQVKSATLTHDGDTLTPAQYARLDHETEPVIGGHEIESESSTATVPTRAEPEGPAPATVPEDVAAASRENALVSWLRIQLHELHLSPYFKRLTLDDSHDEPVTLDQGLLRLGGRSPIITELAHAAEDAPDSPLPLYDLLLHIVCLLERGTPELFEALHASTIGSVLERAAKA